MADTFFFIALLSSHSPLDFLISVQHQILTHMPDSWFIFDATLHLPQAPVLVPSTPPSFLPSHPFLAPSGPRRFPLNCCCGISVLPLLLPQPHCCPWDEACPCIPHFPTCQSNLHSLSSSSRLTPSLRLPHSCFCPSTGPPERAPQPQSASPWPLPFTLQFSCSGVRSYHTASPASQHIPGEAAWCQAVSVLWSQVYSFPSISVAPGITPLPVPASQ